MPYVINARLTALGIEAQTLKNNTASIERTKKGDNRFPIFDKYGEMILQKEGKIQKIAVGVGLGFDAVVKMLPPMSIENVEELIDELTKDYREVRDDPINCLKKLKEEVGFTETNICRIFFRAGREFIKTLKSLASDKTIAKINILKEQIGFKSESLSAMLSGSGAHIIENIEYLVQNEVMENINELRVVLGFTPDNISSILSSSRLDLSQALNILTKDIVKNGINAFQAEATGILVSNILHRAGKSLEAMVLNLNNPQNLEIIKFLQNKNICNSKIAEMMNKNKCDPKKFAEEAKSLGYDLSAVAQEDGVAAAAADDDMDLMDYEQEDAAAAAADEDVLVIPAMDDAALIEFAQKVIPADILTLPEKLPFYQCSTDNGDKISKIVFFCKELNLKDKYLHKILFSTTPEKYQNNIDHLHSRLETTDLQSSIFKIIINFKHSCGVKTEDLIKFLTDPECTLEENLAMLDEISSVNQLTGNAWIKDIPDLREYMSDIQPSIKELYNYVKKSEPAVINMDVMDENPMVAAPADDVLAPTPSRKRVLEGGDSGEPSPKRHCAEALKRDAEVDEDDLYVMRHTSGPLSPADGDMSSPDVDLFAIPSPDDAMFNAWWLECIGKGN